MLCVQVSYKYRACPQLCNCLWCASTYTSKTNRWENPDTLSAPVTAIIQKKEWKKVNWWENAVMQQFIITYYRYRTCLFEGSLCMCTPCVCMGMCRCSVCVYVYVYVVRACMFMLLTVSTAILSWNIFTTSLPDGPGTRNTFWESMWHLFKKRKTKITINKNNHNLRVQLRVWHLCMFVCVLCYMRTYLCVPDLHAYAYAYVLIC